MSAEFAALLRADFEGAMQRMRDSQGKIVLNADDLFRQYPPYENDFAARKVLGPKLYAAASEFRNEAFRRLLLISPTTDNIIVFTAGGGASGKSSGLQARAIRGGVEFFVDTTFSSVAQATEQVGNALAAGRKVEVNYVFRPFDDCVLSMLIRAQNPQVGRVVPIDDMARTHFGSQETVLQIMEKYLGDPRVAVLLLKNVGVNTLEQMSVASLQRRRHPPVDELQRRGQTVLDEVAQGHFATWRGKPISPELYQAAQSQSRKTGAEAAS